MVDAYHAGSKKMPRDIYKGVVGFNKVVDNLRGCGVIVESSAWAAWRVQRANADLGGGAAAVSTPSVLGKRQSKSPVYVGHDEDDASGESEESEDEDEASDDGGAVGGGHDRGEPHAA